MPSAHPEDWDRVTSRNVPKPFHSDEAVCQRKFHWILLSRKLQDLNHGTANPICSGECIEKNEVGMACSTYGGEERGIQGIGGET